MLKQELVKQVAQVTGLTQKDVERVLDAFMNVVQEVLQKGDMVKLTGFGTFLVRHRKARDGVNPRTLEKIKLPAANVPAFKAGNNLKEAVAKAKAS